MVDEERLNPNLPLRLDRFIRQAQVEIKKEMQNADFKQFYQGCQDVWNQDNQTKDSQEVKKSLNEERAKVEQLRKELAKELFLHTSNLQKTFENNWKDLQRSEIEKSVYVDVVLPQESREAALRQQRLSNE